MTAKATLSFCCNGWNGRFTGKFTGLDITCESLDLQSQTDMSLVYTEDDGGDSLHFGTDSIVVAGHEYAIRVDSRIRYEGNLAWDSVQCDRDIAKKLVRFLLSARNFDVESCDETHPFERLAEIPDKRRRGEM
jgi:hypothetical protein